MRKWMLAVSILTMGAMVGCSSTTTEPTPDPVVQNEMLTEEQAKEIVTNEIGTGQIVKVTKDLEDAVPNYDFTILKDNMEYDIEVDAYTGEIRELEQEPQETPTNTVDESKLIGEDKAKEIVLAEVPNGEVVDFEYEADEVVANYDITVRDSDYEYDFEVDAMTGEILKQEKELLNK